MPLMDDPSTLTIDPRWGRKLIERRGKWVLVENVNHVTPSYTIMQAMRLQINDPSSYDWYQKPTTTGEYSQFSLRAAKARFTRLAGHAS